MIKVLGHWELQWQCPIQEYELWLHPLREFNIDHLYMVPITGLPPSRLTEINDIDSIIKQNKDYTVVFVDEAAEDELPDFVHPENALYIMGKTTYSPYLIHFDKTKHTAVKIPSNKNTGGFWSHQAITLILYDRMLKENNGTNDNR